MACAVKSHMQICIEHHQQQRTRDIMSIKTPARGFANTVRALATSKRSKYTANDVNARLQSTFLVRNYLSSNSNSIQFRSTVVHLPDVVSPSLGARNVQCYRAHLSAACSAPATWRLAAMQPAWHWAAAGLPLPAVALRAMRSPSSINLPRRSFQPPRPTCRTGIMHNKLAATKRRPALLALSR